MPKPTQADQRKAQAIMDAHREEVDLSVLNAGSFNFTSAGPEMRDAIAQALADEREANCKAVCAHCARGIPAFEAPEGGRWEHEYVSEYGDKIIYEPCAATAIRARGNHD